MISEKGILSPEFFGKIPNLFEDLLNKYQKWGITLIGTIY